MIIETRGYPTYLERYGAGRPLLMLHGGLGLDHTYLRPWLDPLGDVAELVYFDFYGNGRSGALDQWERVTDNTPWIEQVDALREHLGLDQVVLFGHSYGGYVAQEYAVRHPERVAALVLVTTAPVIDYLDVIRRNAHERGTPEQVRAVEDELFSGRPAADDQSWRRLWNTILPLYFKDFDPEVARRMDARTVYSAAGFNAGHVKALAGFDMVGKLAAVQVPALVIGAAHDWIIVADKGPERIHRELPDSEYVLFDTGHFPFIEQPEAFNQVVSGWLARLP